MTTQKSKPQADAEGVRWIPAAFPTSVVHASDRQIVILDGCYLAIARYPGLGWVGGAMSLADRTETTHLVATDEAGAKRRAILAWARDQKCNWSRFKPAFFARRTGGAL